MEVNKIICCDALDRYIGIELNQKYVDIANKRLAGVSENMFKEVDE